MRLRYANKDTIQEVVELTIADATADLDVKEAAWEFLLDLAGGWPVDDAAERWNDFVDSYEGMEIIHEG